MRNDIGIPPLQTDHGPAPAEPNNPHAREHANGHDGHEKSDPHGPSPARPGHDPHLRHPSMAPEVVNGARHDDLPDFGAPATHPVTERDADGSWYVGIAIAVLAVTLVAVAVAAFVW